MITESFLLSFALADFSAVLRVFEFFNAESI